MQRHLEETTRGATKRLPMSVTLSRSQLSREGTKWRTIPLRWRHFLSSSYSAKFCSSAVLLSEGWCSERVHWTLAEFVCCPQEVYAIGLSMRSDDAFTIYARDVYRQSTTIRDCGAATQRHASSTPLSIVVRIVLADLPKWGEGNHSDRRHREQKRGFALIMQ